MSHKTVLRTMMLGFALVLLLLAGAAYVGYQGSMSIQSHARDLVREHLVNSERGAALEAEIEGQSRDLMDILIWILGACFVFAVAGSAWTIWTTDRAFRQLEWQSEELSRVSWHVVESHEKVARRFAHEMHDELGQALTGLKGMVGRTGSSEIEARRPEMMGVLEEVISGVRELSQLLRPVILDDFGLDAGLRWLTERFAQRTQIEVEYESNLRERLSDSLETHLFRITQEALTNIAKHSGASKAWVRLDGSNGRVTLTILDNGKGMRDPIARPTGGLGMTGMRARARQVEGVFTIANQKSGGLQLRVETPLRRKTDDVEQEDPHLVG